MTVPNLIQERANCLADFHRVSIGIEHRMMERLSYFRFQKLKTSSVESQANAGDCRFTAIGERRVDPACRPSRAGGGPAPIIEQRALSCRTRAKLTQVHNDSPVLHATQHGENGCDVIHTARGSKIWA